MRKMGSSLAITHLTYIAHNSTLSARSVQRSVTRHIEARKCRITLSLTRPVILVGASGLGKSTIAQNIAHHVVIHGHTVLFTTASQLLGDLAALNSDSLPRWRLRALLCGACLTGHR